MSPRHLDDADPAPTNAYGQPAYEWDGDDAVHVIDPDDRLRTLCNAAVRPKMNRITVDGKTDFFAGCWACLDVARKIARSA